MATFRRFNIGSAPYIHYNTVVSDRKTNSLVFASCVGYTSHINQNTKELTKINNVYADGTGYLRTISNGYEFEKRKQSNSDFMHVVIYQKDRMQVTNTEGDERLTSFIFCNDQEDKANRVFDKLYKNTPIPILREWIPYIISQLEVDGSMYQLLVNYDHSKPKPFDCYCLDIRMSILIRIISRGLSLRTIQVNGSNENSEKILNAYGLDSYLNGYGDILATKIQESFVPKFIPGESVYDQKVEDFDDSCYDAGIEIYEAQKATIQASINNLNKNDLTFVVGEMGVGKTLVGAGITYAHNKKNGLTAVVLCPAHLTNKWKREVERFVPDGKGYIIHNLKELTALDSKIRDKSKRENMYIIISKESAKFGYESKPSVRWSNTKRGFVCPHCGQLLTKLDFEGTGRYRQKVITPLGKRDFAKQGQFNMVCNNEVQKWDKSLCQNMPQTCGTKLWSPVNGNDDENRWIKLGAEGWIYREHLTDLYNEYSGLLEINRKDTQFLLRLSDLKSQQDAGEDLRCSSNAPRKFPLAKYIRTYYKSCIDYLIADEVN